MELISKVDIDTSEVSEWEDAFDQVVAVHGAEYARGLLDRLRRKAQGDPSEKFSQTPYVNSIAPEAEPPYPGDERIERRIRAALRWNAAMIVLRANHRHPGIGGHLATYASAVTMYEVGFNWFFRARTEGRSGDQVYFQAHASPGIYARAFLEGRLTEGFICFEGRRRGGRGRSFWGAGRC